MSQGKVAPTSSARAQRRISPIAASKGLFFLAAGLSFLASIYLWFEVSREQGMFVGLWVPSILSAGVLLMVGGKNNG